MPKRSNQFQRLVYLIQNQIQDGIVTESAMLPERHGTGEREVDVYVETEQAGIPIRISFECSASARRVGRPWVDEMVGKHSNLLTDKLVLVSSSGFSKPAIDYAAKHRAETVTFEAAEAVDWHAYIERLRSLMLGLFHFTGKPKTLHWKRLRPEDPDLVLDQLPEEYRNLEKGQKGSWSEMISAILRSPDVARPIMESWLKGEARDKQFVKVLTVNFRNHSNRVISRGIEYIMERLVLDVTVSVDRRPIELSLSSFMGTGVGYGKVADFPAGEAEVTITARPGATPLVSIAIGDTQSTGPLEIKVDADEQ